MGRKAVRQPAASTLHQERARSTVHWTTTYLLVDDIPLLANVNHGLQYWPVYSWFKNSTLLIVSIQSKL